MAAPAATPAAAANAVSAFLKGVEKRALVVADLQGGQPAVADRAVAAAMRAFAGSAAELPMADWPLRFWSLLGRTPQLLEPTSGQWPVPLVHLQSLRPADRLALLLRIGAGLDEQVAAQAAGLQAAAYRQALAAACPLDRRGAPDARAWRELAEQVQVQVRELPLLRLQRLEQLHAGMPLADAAAAATPGPRHATGRRRPRKSRWSRSTWLLLCVPLLLLGVVLAWWWHGRMPAGAPGPAAAHLVGQADAVQVEELPEAGAATPATAVDVHAADDAAMLADPDLALVEDADFYAWHAAGAPVPVDDSPLQPSPTAPTAPTDSALETTDADE